MAQRFVHKQQTRLRQKRPPEGDALALAAGKSSRTTIREIADVQHSITRLPVRGVLDGAIQAPPVIEIFRRQMRKQPRVLEHKTDPASIGKSSFEVLSNISPSIVIVPRRAAACRRSC